MAIEANVIFSDEAEAQAHVGKPLGDTGLVGVSVSAEERNIPHPPLKEGEFTKGRMTVTIYRLHCKAAG